MNSTLLLISFGIFLYLSLIVIVPKTAFEENMGGTHVVLILIAIMITCLVGGLVL